MSVEIALTAPGGPLPAGEPVAISVTLTNRGPAAVLLPRVLDGSEDGSRYPLFRPSVEFAGQVVAAPPPPEDPLTGPITPADFVTLAPGASFDPCVPRHLSTFANFAPDHPGVYRYALTLSTESPDPDRWLGRFGQEAPGTVLPLIAQVVPLTVTTHLDLVIT